MHVVNFVLLILSLFPQHERHEFVGEAGEVEDANRRAKGSPNAKSERAQIVRIVAK